MNRFVVFVLFAVVHFNLLGCVRHVPCNSTYSSTMRHRRSLDEFMAEEFASQSAVPEDKQDPSSSPESVRDTPKSKPQFSTVSFENPDEDLVFDSENSGTSDQAAPSGETDGEIGSNVEPEQPEATPDLVPITVEEARAFALTGNLDLRLQLVDPAVRQEQISVEEGAFEATFSGTFQRDYSEGPPGNFSFGPQDATNDRFVPSVNVPLTTGGTVSVLQNFNYQGLDFAGVSTYDTSPRIRLSQPLLRGTWDQVNTAGIAIAELDAGISESETKLAAIEVLTQTERAYWLLWFNRSRLEIQRLQVQIAENQRNNARRLSEEGVISKVEELRSLSGLRLRENDVIAANTAVLLSQRDLKRLIQNPAIPIESVSQLVPATQPVPVGLKFDRELLAEKAMENRMELYQLYLQLGKQDLLLKVQNNSILPRADIFGEQRVLGSSPASFGSASSNAWDGSYDAWQAGISVDVPLWGNVSARGRRNQTELLRVGTRINIDRTRQAIRQSIFDAVDRFEQSWQGILTARLSVQAAEETLRAEQRLFELGSRTSDLVLLAASNLGTAQIQLSSAILAYQNARVDLARATGTVLGHGHVYWREPHRCHESAVLRSCH
jgi:outer membrane protein